MSRRDYERVVERGGFKYIEVKSGRLLTFWDAHRDAERGFTDLTRGVSRAFKLTDDDYDLERLGWLIENVQLYCDSAMAEINRQRGVKTQEDRIALLRNTTGRTPEEAEMFLRKADELEGTIANGT